MTRELVSSVLTDRQSIAPDTAFHQTVRDALTPRGNPRWAVVRLHLDPASRVLTATAHLTAPDLPALLGCFTDHERTEFAAANRW